MSILTHFKGSFGAEHGSFIRQNSGARKVEGSEPVS